MTIKQILRGLLPEAWHPSRLVRRSIARRAGGRVLSGPFAGMRYDPDRAIGSVLDAKLLGTYELELWPAIDRIVERGFEHIVNIGAGDGYYAVGLAGAVPRARVVAFEQDPAGQAAIKALAEENGVSARVEVRGRCETIDRAASLLEDQACVVCDVEGEEATLLDPDVVPALRRQHLLVEIHEFVARGVARLVQERFETTHEVEVIWQRDRRFSDFPSPPWFQRRLPERYTLAFMHEGRPERMRWLRLTPRRPPP